MRLRPRHDAAGLTIIWDEVPDLPEPHSTTCPIEKYGPEGGVSVADIIVSQSSPCPRGPNCRMSGKV